VIQFLRGEFKCCKLIIILLVLSGLLILTPTLTINLSGSILLKGLVLAILRVWRGDFVEDNEPDDKRQYWRAFVRQTWTFSAVINTISYLGLFVGLVIL
jgi:hypothetical protein